MAKVFGKKIYYKEEIDSTNTEAKRQAAEEGNHGLVVIAEQQTMGRGRRGRSWSSPKGTGIWMSLLLKPELEPEKASMLTIVAALSVADAITEVTGLEAFIKWPNDIVVGGKKVCGILTEMSADVSGIRYVVVGIGINVNTREFPEEIKEIATSLFLEKCSAQMKQKEVVHSESHKQLDETELIDRELLMTTVLDKLEEYYNQFMQSGDLEFILEDYNKKLANRDKQVRIIAGGDERSQEGIARGINKEGELLVETEEGLLEVRSGEVSVRGLYGYV